MKQCKRCGALMNDIAATCPKCGMPVDFDPNNPSNFNQFNNQFTSSKEISFDIKPNLNNPPKDNESKKMLLIIIGVILLLIGIIVSIYFIFNKSRNKEPEASPTIELSKPDENPEPPTSEEPTTPGQPSDPTQEPKPAEPSTPENTYEYNYSIYTFYIPNNYKTSSYQDDTKEMGITLLDEKTGASISFMPGVNTLKGYKEQEQNLTTSMEADGTIVNKIETKMIKNHEIYLLELIQGELHYIMAITPIESKDNTIIMFISDYSNQTKFNYDILNDAISILDNIKISQAPQIID